jgi:hypothetical protein
MLSAEPTKYYTGLTLYGDYWDLDSLRDTICFLADTPQLDENQSTFLMALANDVRKAYEEKRKKETIGPVTYFGVNIFWTVFLFQIAMLRNLAAHVPTNKEHQSNLYRLEACAEAALMKADPKAGQESLDLCKHLYMNWDFISGEQIRYCTKCFIAETRQGKARFKSLPKYLKKILHYLHEDILAFAGQEQKSSMKNDFDNSDWPDFEW